MFLGRTLNKIKIMEEKLNEKFIGEIEMIVSFCVVARNEQECLPRLFEDICAQTYPHFLMEIILVNSMSTDRTRELMEQFKTENKDFKNILVVDNPKKNQAAGWNIAICKSSGDIITRIDAHASVPKEFIQNNVECINSGENISGGPRPCIIDDGASSWRKTLLLAENSMFGSGISPYRRSGEKKYVKSMFHASYRRQVFEKVGGFNENLGRTEDNEIHYRMRKAEYKFCFNPEIISYQFARNNLRKMIKQKFQNGYWIGLTLGICPKCLSLFHFVPFCFVIAIILTTFLLFIGVEEFSQILWLAYCFGAIANTFFIVLNNKVNRTSIFLPILFILLHTSYGVGTFVGILKMPIWRKGKNVYPTIKSKNAST